MLTTRCGRPNCRSTTVGLVVATAMLTLMWHRLKPEVAAEHKFAIDLVDIPKMAANLSTAVFPCPTGRVAGLSFPICTFSAMEDRWVSATFLGNEYWEKTSVRKIVDTLYQLDRTHPIFFIDIGANIGTYSLAAAHAGVQASDRLTIYGRCNLYRLRTPLYYKSWVDLYSDSHNYA